MAAVTSVGVLGQEEQVRRMNSNEREEVKMTVMKEEKRRCAGGGVDEEAEARSGKLDVGYCRVRLDARAG